MIKFFLIIVTTTFLISCSLKTYAKHKENNNLQKSKLKTCKVNINFSQHKDVTFKRKPTDEIDSLEEKDIYKTKNLNCSLKYFNDFIGLSIQCFDLSKNKSRFLSNYYQSDRSGVKEFPAYARLSFKANGKDQYIKVDCN